MDKSLLDYEVSIDSDCKLLTVGKPFAIEGGQVHSAGAAGGPWVLGERGGGCTPVPALPLSPPAVGARLRHRPPPALTADLQAVRVHQPLQVSRLHGPAARQVVPHGALRQARLRRH